MKTIQKYYRVDRKKIYFIKFILEAYDGIATLTTIDSAMGLVKLCIAPDCEKDVDTVLDGLKKDIMIESYNNG